MAVTLDGPGWGRAAGVPPALVFALIASLALHAVALRLMSLAHRAAPELPQPAALRVRIMAPARVASAPRTAAARPEPLAITRPVAPPAHARAKAAPAVRAPRVHATRVHRAANATRVHRAANATRVHRAADATRAPRTARIAPQPRAFSAHARRAPPLPGTSAAPLARAGPARVQAPRALPKARAGASQVRPSGKAAPPRAAFAPDDHLALAQFRSALMAQAQRYARYPRLARDNDWQGTVELRMVIGRDGALASLGVSHGTGYAVLNREALHMLRRAEPLAPIPHALRGRRFSVDIPVIFKLREPG